MSASVCSRGRASRGRGSRTTWFKILTCIYILIVYVSYGSWRQVGKLYMSDWMPGGKPAQAGVRFPPDIT